MFGHIWRDLREGCTSEQRKRLPGEAPTLGTLPELPNSAISSPTEVFKRLRSVNDLDEQPWCRLASLKSIWAPMCRRATGRNSAEVTLEQLMEDDLSEGWERSSISNSVDQCFCRLWLRHALLIPPNTGWDWVMSGRSGGVWLFWLHYIYLVKRALQWPTQAWKDATLARINKQHSCYWAYITRAHLQKKLIWNMSKSRDANGPRRQNCNLRVELSFQKAVPW